MGRAIFAIPIYDQSHLIQNQWLVVTPQIKVRKNDWQTHLTLETHAHKESRRQGLNVQ